MTIYFTIACSLFFWRKISNGFVKLWTCNTKWGRMILAIGMFKIFLTMMTMEEWISIASKVPSINWFRTLPVTAGACTRNMNTSSNWCGGGSLCSQLRWYDRLVSNHGNIAIEVSSGHSRTRQIHHTQWSHPNCNYISRREEAYHTSTIVRLRSATLISSQLVAVQVRSYQTDHVTAEIITTHQTTIQVE